MSLLQSLSLELFPFKLNQRIDVIPGGVDADWYAHGAGGAAMRQIEELYQKAFESNESNPRPSGISHLF